MTRENRETTVFITHHRSIASDATKAIIIKDLELNPGLSYKAASEKYGFRDKTIARWYISAKGLRFDGYHSKLYEETAKKQKAVIPKPHKVYDTPEPEQTSHIKS